MIVCDGLVGNVALKVTESVVHAFEELLKRELKSNLLKPIQEANKDVQSEIFEQLSSMVELRNYFDNFKQSNKILFRILKIINKMKVLY